MSQEFVGQLTLDLLFKQSKSEGYYPVLHCDDGNDYRVHTKSEFFKQESYLMNYIDKYVHVIGDLDDIRGPYRIIIDPEVVDSIYQIPSVEDSINEGFDGES